MKLLDGREAADFIKARHAGEVRGLPPMRLAIVRQGATAATDMYLRVKQRYGDDIGIDVDLYTETGATLLKRIHQLNSDDSVMAINVELPFTDAPELTNEALAAVTPSKDVEGFAPGSEFEVVTPKAIMWLLAAYNIDLKARRIGIVGLGKLVGAPLAERLEASGHTVMRCDEHTKDLAAQLSECPVVITATGQPGLITASMLADGAVVVDAGAPKSDLADDVLARPDLTRTPNPGGVGPMTVAALFDNVILACRRARK
ncbi:bifunctional 5,10-methylenetetrahydrofolate dehydrogenase/5,10-methenyltetrahydrofolate cyclohydrolase [Candidatus Saccharibacteria bacterium]|nr:bifunctional 5,10-methylenetetrahydrofolate dehydrogenase/5,10-methenyltetrahydrofolate cyclohydrolase [Candidatus Saccharibacteria bacterium]